jgi:hypothetical protein
MAMPRTADFRNDATSCISICYAGGVKGFSPEGAVAIKGRTEAATESLLFNLEIGDWTLDVGYSGVTEEFQYSNPISNTQYPMIKGRKEAATEHQAA